MTDTILYERRGHIARVTLNLPERHNALGREQLDALRGRLDQVATDGEVRVLVLTGAGDKTFCAGASLSELSAGDISDDVFQQMTGQLASLAVPTICALNGSVYGGGVELALSCDFRIGVDGSRMRVPAAAIGLCYPLSGIRRFVEVLGVNLAKRVLVASEEFSAADMLAIGFLDHLVAPPVLADKVDAQALHIAGLAPLAVQAMKSLLREAAYSGIDEAHAQELAGICLASADLQEGFAAKREKRVPHFEGR